MAAVRWPDLEDTGERLLGRCLRRQAEAVPDDAGLHYGATTRKAGWS